MRKLAPFAALLLLVGCAPKDAAETTTAAPSSGGVEVVPTTSGAAGGMTPVTGTENLGGTNGGSGAVMKDMARGAASKLSAPPTAGSGDVDGAE